MCRPPLRRASLRLREGLAPFRGGSFSPRALGPWSHAQGGAAIYIYVYMPRYMYTCVHPYILYTCPVIHPSLPFLPSALGRTPAPPVSVPLSPNTLTPEGLAGAPRGPESRTPGPKRGSRHAPGPRAGPRGQLATPKTQCHAASVYNANWRAFRGSRRPMRPMRPPRLRRQPSAVRPAPSGPRRCQLGCRPPSPPGGASRAPPRRRRARRPRCPGGRFPPARQSFCPGRVATPPTDTRPHAAPRRPSPPT